MKLCYVAPFESIHTMRWLDYFSRENEVHLVSVCRGNLSDYQDAISFYKNRGINLHLVESSSNISPIALYKVVQKIHQIKPDLVHGFYLTNHAFAAALSMYRPFVASAWGSDVLIDPKKNPLFQISSLITIYLADLITCDGFEVWKKIKSKSLFWKDVVQICHGVDLNRFKVIENGERENVVIYTRGFQEVYDPTTLVEVIDLVVKEKPDVKFLLLGNGSMMNEVKEKIEQNGCTENVEFLGHVDHKEMPEIYAKGKVYLSTSLSDSGIAIGTLEAMACGLPIVVTDSGGHKRDLLPFVHGYISPKKRADLMAQAILEHLGWSRSILSLMGEVNRCYVERFGNYEKEMEKMGDYYHILIGEVKQ